VRHRWEAVHLGDPGVVRAHRASGGKRARPFPIKWGRRRPPLPRFAPSRRVRGRFCAASRGPGPATLRASGTAFLQDRGVGCQLKRPWRQAPCELMAESCPHCGASTHFSPQDARVLHGTCPECGVTSTIVQATAAGVEPASPSGPSESASVRPELDAREARPAEPGPACPVCGTALTLRAWSVEAIEAGCVSCGSTTRYRAMREDRGPRPRGTWERRGREGGPAMGGPRGRPCRECGGPLSFTTDAEGVLTGECAQCGNRFTLPPRTYDRATGPPRDRTRGFRSGFPPRGRGPYGAPRAEGRFPRRAGGRPRFRPRDREDESDEDDRPERRRRRPRRE